MIKYPVYNQQGGAVGERELKPEVFGVKTQPDLLHQAMVAQQANARQVLAHTKDRSEVAGGGKKPWRQKGTGRARAGSSRSPLWRGGGITFGPTNARNFSKSLNKKMKQQALLMALSDKVETKQLALIDKWQLTESKTRAFNQLLGGLENQLWGDKIKRDCLIVSRQDAVLAKAARNLPHVKVINLDNINLIDLLRFKYLLTDTAVIDALEKQYSK